MGFTGFFISDATLGDKIFSGLAAHRFLHIGSDRSAAATNLVRQLEGVFLSYQELAKTHNSNCEGIAFMQDNIIFLHNREPPKDNS